jgi:hypothetical protein
VYQDNVELRAARGRRRASHARTAMVRVFAQEAKVGTARQAASGGHMGLARVVLVVALQGNVECLAVHVHLDRRRASHARTVQELTIAVGELRQGLATAASGVPGALVLAVHVHVL